MIIFDTTTGNIVAGTTYFINTVSNDSSNQITIKATLTGGTFDLADASTPGNYVLGRGYGRQSSNSSTATATFGGTIATTGASGTGATATITFAAQTYAPFYLGQTITVAGVTPAGYNGSHVVTACTTSSVSFASAESGAYVTPGTVTCVSTIN